MTQRGVVWNLVWEDFNKLIRLVKHINEREGEQARPKPEPPVSDDSSIDDEEDDYEWVKIAE